ncbi:MAG: dTDP-4-dehydrorhamnose 3,5-epimerase [Spirochaetia bacterium]|nr:dTDP-4-dehydrorhamnose 3,5-epimerase [Spirochaetia bacterium]
MPFQFRSCSLPGLIVISPTVYTDDRGFFMESFKESDFIKAGITERFIQDNVSRSCEGTLRGLHFQHAPYAQAKLVRCSRGRLWDVAVDIRPGSASYGQWSGLELSEHNRLIHFLPAGFAHGFLALEDDTELCYSCSAEYSAEHEGGIRWNDPELAIAWPSVDVLVSAKDAALPFLKDLL